MADVIFKVKEITLKEGDCDIPFPAYVAVDRGLAALYRYGVWGVVHLRSGQLLPNAAFTTQLQVERFITEIVNVLDWRNGIEAIISFLDHDNIKSALIAATKAAWEETAA